MAVRLETKKICREYPQVQYVINNAIKFSYPNTTITLRACVQDQDVVISVQDQGQGIPAQEVDDLFTDFGRTSVRPTAGEKSTGLGLSIVKRIVELHGGRRAVVLFAILRGLKNHEDINRISIWGVFIPLFKPKGFVYALDIAGTYGGGMFVRILPVLMVLSSRKKAKTIKHMTWGGKWMPYSVLFIYMIGICYGSMKLLS